MAKGDRSGSQETASQEQDQQQDGGAVGTAVLDNPEQQVGDGDRANALAADPSTEQVTQTGDPAPAEGQRIREQARADAEERDFVTLAEAITTGDRTAVRYDDAGVLVNGDGKRIALTADAADPDVGWTVQQAQREDNPVAYPGGPSGVPDQTVHPDELPDPVAALQAGLLPQNAGVLNVDQSKFEGKKSLEP